MPPSLRRLLPALALAALVGRLWRVGRAGPFDERTGRPTRGADRRSGALRPTPGHRATPDPGRPRRQDRLEGGRRAVPLGRLRHPRAASTAPGSSTGRTVGSASSCLTAPMRSTTAAGELSALESSPVTCSSSRGSATWASMPDAVGWFTHPSRDGPSKSWSFAARTTTAGSSPRAGSLARRRLQRSPAQRSSPVGREGRARGELVLGADYRPPPAAASTSSRRNRCSQFDGGNARVGEPPPRAADVRVAVLPGRRAVRAARSTRSRRRRRRAARRPRGTAPARHAPAV